MGIRRRFALLGAVLAAATALSPTAQAAGAPEYVALGDSAAAGPLVGSQNPNIVCLRSNTNYPRVAAKLLGARLRDVTCSGAKLAAFAGHQWGFLPPQFNALSESTDLVTVTIGGNDVDLVGAAVSCLNAFPEPMGRSCRDRFTAGGHDQLAERIDAIGPQVGRAFAEIRHRAPRARLLVVGYATYIRPNGCYPTQPMWARDATYIQSSVDRLSALLAREAAAHGAEFLDLAPVSRGHDACAPPHQRYIEGVVPSRFTAPLHPNAAGMDAFGRAVATAVGSAKS